MAHILIIEDDKVLNQAYRLILENEGHHIETAFNGVDGLKKAEAKEPDIILLDLLMPNMGGLDFLKSYEPGLKHKHVKVVILSNIGDEHEAAKGMQLGAYKYIVKAHASPHDLSLLVKHLISKNFSTNVNQAA